MPDDVLADFENELLAAISMRTKDHAALLRLVADLKMWYDDIDRQDIIICLYRLHLAAVNELPDPQLIARIPRKDMT